jgi:hypothetical protein
MKRFIIIALAVALVVVFMIPVAFADPGGAPNANACLGQLRAAQAADYHDGGAYDSIGDMLTTLHTPPAEAPGWLGAVVSAYARGCS